MTTYIIGRSKECDIQIETSSVSRQHAALTITSDNQYFVKDLDGTFGTYVAGETEWKEVIDRKLSLSRISCPR